MTATTTAIVPVEKYRALTVPVEQVRDIIAENVGTGGITQFDLDRVKIPTGGGTAWSVPTLDGEEEIAKELLGIIVLQRDARAFWSTGLEQSGGGSPPDCASDDGQIGIGEPGGECATCPLAEWGSKGGGRRGQACKSIKLVFLLRPDSLLPMVVSLPPTSIGPMRKYFLRLASQAIPFYAVVTRLTLSKATNAQGIAYAQVVPSVAGPVPQQQLGMVRSYAAAIKPALMRVSTVTDFEQEDAA